MSKITIKIEDALSKTTKTSSTPTLRWNDEVLEQLWMIEEISPVPGVQFEWRKVPTVGETK